MATRALREEDEWEFRPGRLQEDAGAEERIARRLFAAGSRGRAPVVAHPQRPPGRPVSADGRCAVHFRHSTIAKIPPAPTGAVPRGRTAVYPLRGAAVRLVRELGGVRGRDGVWHVPAEAAPRAFVVAGPGGGRRVELTGGAARARWLDARLSGRTKAGAGRGAAQCERRPPGTAREHQRYIERAELTDEERRSQLVADAEGFVSFGTMGATLDDRLRAWDAVEGRERADGRVQCRAIVEIPHEIRDLPGAVRRLARELVRPLAERGLPYWVSAHLPEVAHGTDPRNVHFHVVYHDRPAEWRDGRLVFAARKDREARDDAWVAGWREAFVEAANAELAAAGAVKRYDARGYAEMGVAVVPADHLGPAGTGRERAGLWSAVGLRNGRTSAPAPASEGAARPGPVLLGPDSPDACRVRRLTAGRPEARRRPAETSAAEALRSWTSAAEREAEARRRLVLDGARFRLDAREAEAARREAAGDPLGAAVRREVSRLRDGLDAADPVGAAAHRAARAGVEAAERDRIEAARRLAAAADRLEADRAAEAIAGVLAEIDRAAARTAAGRLRLEARRALDAEAAAAERRLVGLLAGPAGGDAEAAAAAARMAAAARTGGVDTAAAAAAAEPALAGLPSSSGAAAAAAAAEAARLQARAAAAEPLDVRDVPRSLRGPLAEALEGLPAAGPGLAERGLTAAALRASSAAAAVAAAERRDRAAERGRDGRGARELDA